MQQPAASRSSGETGLRRLVGAVGSGVVGIVLILAGAFSPLVQAQTDSDSVSLLVGLPQLIEWTDTRNPDILSAQAEVAAARRKLEQVQRAYSGTLMMNTQLPWQPGDELTPSVQLSGNVSLPMGISVSSTVTARRSLTDTASSTQVSGTAAGASQSGVTGSVALNVNAWDFLAATQRKASRNSQLLQAESDLEKAERALQEARTQARLQVVQLYWEIQILEQQIELEEENLDQLRQTEERVRAQVSRGQATTSDLIKAQLDRFQLENQIQTDRQSLQAKMDTLVEATGGSGEYRLKPGILQDTWSAPALRYDELLQQALANSISLKADRVAVTVAQLRLEEAKRERLPQVTLAAQMDFGAGRSSEASVLARADWTVWDAGQTDGQIDDLQETLEAARRRLSQDELAVRQSVLAAWNKVQQAQRSLDTVSLQRSQAEETARLVDQQAELGAVTETRKQEAQRQLRSAELNLASARHNLFLAVASLQNQVGLPVDWAILGVNP